MFRVLLLCATLGVALCSLRFDTSRSLIKLPGRSVDDFPALEKLGLKGEEVETWETDHLLVWATQEQKVALNQAGFNHGPAVDIGATSFAEEKANNYTDKVGEEPDWSQYCGYDCMTERLKEMESTCKVTATLMDIGKTVRGRSIWVLKIGNSGPEVLMAGNIHGDETTGGQLLQRWAWETCNKASDEQSQVANSVQAYYMPMYNPDGYEANRRGNGNNADLNRSFPPPTGGNGSPQPETNAFMNFVKSRKFEVSIMYHGGAVVCNYAYDNCYTSNLVPRPCPPAATTYHARNSQVVPSAKSYADALVASGTRCTVGSGCMVNGASWYQITGSLQDWAFHFENSLDLTMEVSSTKRPAGSQLPGFYTSNTNAIYKFMTFPTHK